MIVTTDMLEKKVIYAMLEGLVHDGWLPDNPSLIEEIEARIEDLHEKAKNPLEHWPVEDLATLARNMYYRPTRSSVCTEAPHD